MKQINIVTDYHKNLNRSTMKATPWLEPAKPQPAGRGNKELKNQLTARPKLMLSFLILLCGFLTFMALQSPSAPKIKKNLIFSGGAFADPFASGGSNISSDTLDNRASNAAMSANDEPITTDTFQAGYVEKLDVRELIKQLSKLLKAAENNAMLAYELSQRLAWCQPKQGVKEEAVRLDDPENGLFAPQSQAAYRYQQCSGLSDSNLALAPKLLERASQLGVPEARLDLAQNNMDELRAASRKSRYETNEEASTLQFAPDANAQNLLINQVQQLAHAGNPRALMMMAEHTLGKAKTPENRDDFVAYMLVSQLYSGEPIPFEQHPLLLSAQPKDADRMLEKAKALFQQCCDKPKAGT